MKTYEFKIEVEDFNNGSGLLDSLIDEVKDEKRQLAITHSINKETTKVHMQILKDFCAELSNEFRKIGLGDFGDFRDDISGDTNQYRKSFARLLGGLYGLGVVISVEGVSARHEFSDSKYTTFTGKYEMYLYKNSTEYYCANQMSKSKTKINNIADVIKNLEFQIKEYLHKQKDLV